MKQIIITIILLLIGVRVNGQLDKICVPKKLIVAAENLNFRSKPNTKTKPICKLDNSELLTFIELHIERGQIYFGNLQDQWVKVKRNRTGEIGYVFGKYILSQEMAYMNYHDSDRLQTGNWYGIYHEAGKLKIEKTNPTIEELDEGYLSIQSHPNHRLIICSQEEIKTGNIEGELFNRIEIGQQKELIQIGNFKYSLICSKDKTSKKGQNENNGKLIFIKNSIDDSEKNHLQQEISNCMYQFGENGYELLFAGDLNNDGIPELIIAESFTGGGAVYYFKSNEEGELELQSVTGVDSKC